MVVYAVGTAGFVCAYRRSPLHRGGLGTLFLAVWMGIYALEQAHYVGVQTAFALGRVALPISSTSPSSIL